MTTIPKETVEDIVRFYPLFNCYKHNLSNDPDEYTNSIINHMSNVEFLNVISDAIEERLELLANKEL